MQPCGLAAFHPTQLGLMGTIRYTFTVIVCTCFCICFCFLFVSLFCFVCVCLVFVLPVRYAVLCHG